MSLGSYLYSHPVSHRSRTCTPPPHPPDEITSSRLYHLHHCQHPHLPSHKRTTWMRMRIKQKGLTSFSFLRNNSGALGKKKREKKGDYSWDSFVTSCGIWFHEMIHTMPHNEIPGFSKHPLSFLSKRWPMCLCHKMKKKKPAVEHVEDNLIRDSVPLPTSTALYNGSKTIVIYADQQN